MRKGEKREDLKKARIGKCEICGEEYRAVKDYVNKNGYVRTQKYCSKECWSNRAKKTKHSCEYCGKEFEIKGSDNSAGRYCSRECSFKGQVGEKAPAYKDGKSLERERARHSNDLSIWRKKVYKRDGHKCIKCGSRELLHAHHILSWAEHEDLRFDVNNGQTLCEKCHGEIHGKDFSNRKPKQCKACGKEIKGKGRTGLCRSCVHKKAVRSHG
jgi:hypothetical protein